MDKYNRGFYVMVFSSANHSIQTEKKARERFRITVIPTPREIASDCGLAIKFLDTEISAIKTFHNSLTIPADLYLLSNEKIGEKREVEKVL